MASSFRGSAGAPKYAKSKIFWNTGSTVSSVYVTLTYSGDVHLWLCADGDTESWEEVTLESSGVRGSHVFSTTGTQLKWYAVLGRGASISEIRISVAG